MARRAPFPYAGLQSELEETTRQADGLTGRLTDAQLVWLPPEGGWSIGQCLEHLIVVADEYAARLTPRLDEAHAATDAPYLGGHKSTLLGKLFVDAVKPARRRRLKTPRKFAPAPQPRANVAEEFRRSQERTGELLERGKGIDLSAWKIRSPVTALIRFNLGDALLLLVYHAQRHLDQAVRVTEHPEFPPA